MEYIMTKHCTLRQDGQALDLEYALTVCEADGRICYGAAVRCGDESAAVADLTSERAMAERFLERIAAGGVTPVTLRDVAEDFVAEA